MYLLNTDILSNIAKRTPSTAPVAKLALVPQEAQFTSSITLGEMVYGAHKLQTHTHHLLDRLEKALLPHLLVLPFDGDAACRYGEVRAELERQGTPPKRTSELVPSRSPGA